MAEPIGLQDAMRRPEWDKWKVAVDDEYNSLLENGTWSLVECPAGRKLITNKWVFKLKSMPDGSTKYKARLVARGFTQVEGVDYKETFAPVVRYTSLRLLLAIANQRDMEVHQMDVKTAFLYGELEEEIYMKQPQGKEDPDQPNFVCKLHKSLYGLKQSPRCWNKKIHAFMEGQDLRRLVADPALYTRGAGRQQVLLAIYVDDLLIAGEDKAEIVKVKQALSSAFKMVDFGEVTTVLGIKVQRDRRAGLLTMSQKKYVEEVLARFGMEEAKPVAIPMATTTVLSKAQCPQNEEEARSMAGVPYRSLVGSLMYLMVSTRPDLAYPVGVLSRFLENPGRQHWEAGKRLLRYVLKTKSLGLAYRRVGSGTLEGVVVSGFVDASHGGCLDTTRSTTGWVMMMGGAAVSWCSQRQSTTSLSTCESEFKAATEAVKEVEWQRNFLKEVGMEQEGPTVVYSDSRSALDLMAKEGFTSRTKHLDHKLHFIREHIQEGKVQFVHLAGEEMPADSLTKALPKDKLEAHMRSMGLFPVTV